MKVKNVIVDKLPIDCRECKLTIDTGCGKECIFLFAQYEENERPSDCPLKTIDSFLSTMPEDKEENLISKLDKWIADCEKQSNDFFKRGMTHSEMGSMAMAQAYKNVKELFNPSK